MAPDGVYSGDVLAKPIWGRISGSPTGSAYPWSQIDENDTAFADYTAAGMGLSGTAAGRPAREVNGVTTVATGTKVQMWLAPSGEYYLFDGGGSSLPLGGYLLLCEVTVSATLHTVKRKTRDGSNNIIDFAGPVTYGNCLSTTAGTLPVGTIVLLDPIPDHSGYYWITPAAYATATLPGFLSIAAQSIKGAKTFIDDGRFNLDLRVDDDLQVDGDAVVGGFVDAGGYGSFNEANPGGTIDLRDGTSADPPPGLNGRSGPGVWVAAGNATLMYNTVTVAGNPYTRGWTTRGGTHTAFNHVGYGFAVDQRGYAAGPFGSGYGYALGGTALFSDGTYWWLFVGGLFISRTVAYPIAGPGTPPTPGGSGDTAGKYGAGDAAGGGAAGGFIGLPPSVGGWGGGAPTTQPEAP